MSIKKNYGSLPLAKQRLDVVLVRAKFALTLSQARQLILNRQVYVNGTVITNSFFVLKERNTLSVSPLIKKIVKHNIKQSIQTQNSIVSQYSLFEVKYITQKIVNLFDSLKTNEFFKLDLEILALTTSYQIICVLFLLHSTSILKFSEIYVLALFLLSFMGNILSYIKLTKTEILVKFPMLLTMMLYFAYTPCFICVEFPIYLPIVLIVRIFSEYIFPGSVTITINKYGWFFGVAIQTTCYASLIIYDLPLPSSFCMGRTFLEPRVGIRKTLCKFC